jgi:tetratricopeptide (TPR) repeat protein
VAPKDDKNTDAPASNATPTFDPKPVNVGGESLVDRIYPHRKKIGMFFVLGFAVWGVIAIVIHFRDSKREKQTDKVAAVLDVASRKVNDGTPVDPADPLAKKRPEFKDAKERATAILDALAKLGDEVAGPVYRASVLVEAGKLDEAIAEYKKGVAGNGLDGVLAREGLGLAQEMKAEAEKDPGAKQKGLQEALATFASMQPDETGPRRAYALYHQGRVLDVMQKTADARAMFEQAKAAGKDVTELAPMIDERIAKLGT